MSSLYFWLTDWLTICIRILVTCSHDGGGCGPARLIENQLSHNNYEAHGFRLESAWIHFILRKLNFLLIVQFSLFSFFFSYIFIGKSRSTCLVFEVGSDTWGMDFTSSGWHGGLFGWRFASLEGKSLFVGMQKLHSNRCFIKKKSTLGNILTWHWRDSYLGLSVW